MAFKNHYLPQPPQRLVDYYVKVGLNQPLIRLPYNERPIVDLELLSEKDELSNDFERINYTISGNKGDLNGDDMFAASLYLSYRRSDDNNDLSPITDIAIIYPERKERCPPGYIVVPGNLNKNSYGEKIILCYSTTGGARFQSEYPPIIDISLANEDELQSVPNDYTVLRKNLNAGSFRKPLFFCIRRLPTSPLAHNYKPCIVDRFPQNDYSDTILPNSIAMFCHPNGAQFLEEHNPLLVNSGSFVLTEQSGAELYGVYITFYEEYNYKEFVDKDDKNWQFIFENDKKIYAPTTLCIISHWAFYNCFKLFLGELYRISIGISKIPIERYIINLFETPLPRTSNINVQLSIGTKKIILDRPPDDNFPFVDISIEYIFKLLSFETFIQTFASILTEKKVIIVSKHTSALTQIAEIFRVLIFPFTWQYAFVPLWPPSSVGILEAPMPILVGVPTDNIVEQVLKQIESGVVVDLDRDEIILVGNTKLTRLPKKLEKELEMNLIEISNVDFIGKKRKYSNQLPFDAFDSVFDYAPPPDRFHSPAYQATQNEADKKFDEIACRASFLHLFVKLLGNFNEFLLFPDMKLDVAPSFTDLFNSKAFLKQTPYREFLTIFTATQTFCHFIDEKSFASPRYAEIEFFNQAVNYESQRIKALQKVGPQAASVPTLIQHLCRIDTTEYLYVVPQPSVEGLDDMDNNNNNNYVYDKFPNLNPKLMYFPRDISMSYIESVNTYNHDILIQQFRDAFILNNEEVIVEEEQTEKKPDMYLNSMHDLNSKDQTPTDWAKQLLLDCYACWFRIIVSQLNPNVNVDEAITNVFAVLSDMMEKQLPPDEVIFRQVLIICGTYRKKAEAQVVFDSMKKFNIQPSNHTYTAYVSAYTEGVGNIVESNKKTTPKNAENVSSEQKKLRRISAIPKTLQPRSKSSGDNLTSIDDQIIIEVQRRQSEESAIAEQYLSEELDTINLNSLRMSLSHKCENCHVLLLEADIMAGWQYQDDDMDKKSLSKCTWCHNNVFEPLLNISYEYYKLNDNTKISNHKSNVNNTMHIDDNTMNSDNDNNNKMYENSNKINNHEMNSNGIENKNDEMNQVNWKVATVKYRYMCPHILRNEIYSIARLYPDDYSQSNMLRLLHPVQYWNLMWYFSNMSVPMHILTSSNDNLAINELYSNTFEHTINIDMFYGDFYLSKNSRSHLVIDENELLTWSMLSNNSEYQLKYNKFIDSIMNQLKKEIRNQHYHAAINIFFNARSKDTNKFINELLNEHKYKYVNKYTIQMIVKDMIWTRSLFFELERIEANLSGKPDNHKFVDFHDKFAKTISYLPSNLREQIQSIDDSPNIQVLTLMDIFNLGRKCTRFNS